MSRDRLDSSDDDGAGRPRHRRRPIDIATVRTWIVSREDLILSKLVWALESGSELQRRDVRQLLVSEINLDYIHLWAPRLGVATLLGELMS